MGRVVLVTGVAHALGDAIATRLAADPAVDGVIGVDVTPPRDSSAKLRFVEADIRTSVISEVLVDSDVDTVVHADVLEWHGSESATKEINVIGTMRLLAGCLRAPALRRLIVKTSADVYGSSARDPAMFTEDAAARRPPASGFGRQCWEVEGYVRGFERRRPDVAVTTLRPAYLIGSRVRSGLTEMLRLPAIPKSIGYDARLQLLHVDDLVDCLRHAALAGVPGTFNVAGDGILLLSQVTRRMKRPVLPMPDFVLGQLSRGLRESGVATFGRGLDTSRMRAELGFEPTYTTERAFADFLAAEPLAGVSVEGFATDLGRHVWEVCRRPEVLFGARGDG